MRKRANPKTELAIGMCRARIAKGGDLDPETLSRSFGLPISEVNKLLPIDRRI